MRPSTSAILEKFGSNPILGAEIGVLRGIHSRELLSYLNLEKLYLIDIWEPYFQEGKEVKGISDFYPEVVKEFGSIPNVEIVNGTSKESSKSIKNKSLHFVYIDANHEYEEVKDDIEFWLPKLVSGGILSGHDYNTKSWAGVTEAVDEFVVNNSLVLNTGKTFRYREPKVVWDWWVVV